MNERPIIYVNRSEGNTSLAIDKYQPTHEFAPVRIHSKPSEGINRLTRIFRSRN
ncbi:uncharacterized protein METZ01_LOCUS502387 [marine metagenome]|uniref:Uncharacterized protein n=1 Tax=marine metagenome TaxID=408172 RepID=A0A383DZ92_9ZZZZ